MQNPEEEEEDELDKLMNSYNEQAQVDLKAAFEAETRPTKRKKLSAREKTTAALDVPLAADNKGYQMLLKSGYKPGTGLGKQEEQSIKEPISIAFKQNKLGLGRVSQREQKRKAAQQTQQALEAQQEELLRMQDAATADNIEQHRHLQADRYLSRKVEGQLRASQKALEALDVQHGIAENIMWLHQPPQPPPITSEPADILHDEDTVEKVDGIDGIQTEDQQEEEQEENGWTELASVEKLEKITRHLRETYAYCLYCGVKYRDAEDMEGNCPGPDEDLH